MYKKSLYRNSMPMSEFINRYQNVEKYLAYCKECPNYNTLWSCPSLSFDIDGYLSKFSFIYLIAIKMDLSKETIEAADTAEKIKSVTKDILWKEKAWLQDKLLDAEKLLPGTTSFTAGGCTLCASCARKENKPCRQPDKMRYSLDSFGFDLSAITHDLLGYDIQWCKGRLPDYYTLVHAFLSPEPVPENFWKKCNLAD